VNGTTLPTRPLNLFNVQAAFAIRGIGIRGFDYLRTQKPRVTRETCHFGAKLA